MNAPCACLGAQSTGAPRSRRPVFREPWLATAGLAAALLALARCLAVAIGQSPL